MGFCFAEHRQILKEYSHPQSSGIAPVWIAESEDDATVLRRSNVGT